MKNKISISEKKKGNEMIIIQDAEREEEDD